MRVMHGADAPMIFPITHAIRQVPRIVREIHHDLDDLARAVETADNWWSVAMGFVTLVLALMIVAIAGFVLVVPFVAVGILLFAS